MKKISVILCFFIIAFLNTGAGYMGTLPNIEAEFSYLKKQDSEKSISPYSVEELDKENQSELKPIPRDNDDYVDIIIKKDKSSRYINDINSIIVILEKFRKCMNNDGDIQKFNAIASNLIDNIEYLRTEYKDKPESNYLSYNKLIQLSLKTRDTASYRTKGLLYEKYIPYTSSDNIYTKENLSSKLENLLNDVNDTIYILKNLE